MSMMTTTTVSSETAYVKTNDGGRYGVGIQGTGRAVHGGKTGADCDADGGVDGGGVEPDSESAGVVGEGE